MNKKQSVVAWITGILLSIVAFSVDYYRNVGPKFSNQQVFTIAGLLKFGIPVLIIGSLLIYTLRDKKR